MGVRFEDYPNIIRLNPNIPYKTRGNAAVALRIEIPETMLPTVVETTIQIVEANSKLGEKATDPAVVFVPNQPPKAVVRLSRNALTGIVSVEEAARVVRGTGGVAISFGTGRGLVGALAAVGETLGKDHTFELIGYRLRRNLGKPRRVESSSVITMDRLTVPNTFNSYDAENKRILVTPHGPDPVLFGLRGETAEAVRMAFGMIRIREPIERWVIFRTNHGTESHFPAQEHTGPLLMDRPIRLRGRVNERPERIRGGHVFLKVLASGQVVQCAAFEPTGKFRDIVAKLIPGDEVTVFGGLKSHSKRKKALTVNLEKLIVNRLADEIRTENPRCPKCGKRMKSAGSGQGFKCPRCRHESPRASKRLIRQTRAIRPGTYVPTKKAHRHLTKPLSRYGLEKERWGGKPPTGIWHVP